MQKASLQKQLLINNRMVPTQEQQSEGQPLKRNSKETWFWVLGWFFRIIAMIVNRFVIFLVCSKRQLRAKASALVVS